MSMKEMLLKKLKIGELLSTLGALICGSSFSGRTGIEEGAIIVIHTQRMIGTRKESEEKN